MVLKIVVFDEADYEWARDFHERWPALPFHLSCGTSPPRAGESHSETLSLLGERYRWLCERAAGDPAMTDATVAFGPYRLDPNRRVLTLNGKRVVLGGRALDILCTLAQADGEPIDKDELLATVWPGANVGDNNLHVHISALRKLLGDAGRAHLVTLPGFGYRLLSSTVPVVSNKLSSDRPVLGVIPFRSLSEDGNSRRFAETFNDDLITQLARSRCLRVVADSSVFRGGSDARVIGERFGAN